MISGSFWNHFEVILGSFWDHFGVILGSLRDHFQITLGSFWNDYGAIFGLLSGHFGMILKIILLKSKYCLIILFMICIITYHHMFAIFLTNTSHHTFTKNTYGGVYFDAWSNFTQIVHQHYLTTPVVKKSHELASRKTPRNLITMNRYYLFGWNLMVTSIWPGYTTFDTFWAIFCIRL